MKKMLIVTLIIIAALVTSALAILQHLDTDRDKKQAGINEKNLNDKIDGLLNKNDVLTNKLADLAILNTNLSEQLSKASNKLNDNTLGGSLIKPNGYLVDENSFKFQFINKDKLPIYDLFVSVIDLDLAKIGGVVSEDSTIVRFSSKNIANYLDQNSSQLNIKSFMIMNKVYSLKEGQSKHFYVSMSCRKNNQVMQIIVFKRGKNITEIHRTYEIVNDKWKIIEEDGYADENYWKEFFYNNREFGFDSTK